MADINDFIVELMTKLNTTQAINDVKQLENDLKKKNISLKAVLNTSGNKQIMQKFAVEIQDIFKKNGVNIDIGKIMKSLDQVAKQAESTANKVSKIKFSIDNGHGVSDYQNRINKLISDFEKYGVATDKAKKETESLRKALSEMKKPLSDNDLLSWGDKIEQEFKSVKVSVEQAKLAYDKFNQPVSNEKATSLINRINTFLTKNTRITKDAKVELEGYTKELERGVNLSRWNEISGKLKDTENSMRGLGRLGASLKSQMAQAAESFTQWISISSGIMFLVSQTRSAISEIKELDNILTEISKTSNMTGQQLKQLGMDAYDSASKYGRTASDYLTGVQEMNRSGFYGKKGTAMAEQSLLAQSAGDLSAESADKYVLATNAAYKFQGNAEKINEVLDGQNSITNKNSVAMEDMAEAMTKAGTVASSYRVSIEDLSAMIGTMEAVTKLGGDEVGNALKAILIQCHLV